MLGAVLTANAGVSAISFTFQSGPNTPMISGVNNSFADSAKIVDTGRVYINNLVVGTYLIKVVGTDKSGGVTAPQYDSIVVSPAVVTTCPPQRTVTAISIVVFGVTLNITAGQGTKVTMSDGSTQSF